MPQGYNKLTIKTKISPSQILLAIATAMLLIVVWCINLLPYRYKLGVGKKLGLLLYWIPNARTDITRTNLSLCFPDMASQQKEALVKATIQNFGAGLIETAISWWDDLENIHAMTEIRGQAHMEAALAQGKGVILIGAHFSTLELSIAMLGKYYDYYAVYREQTNWLLNWFMKRGRSRSFLGGIPHSSMRAVLRQIKSGSIVWYSPDQDMGENHSVYAPFFGHIAATVNTTARLSMLTAAPLVMYVSYRKQDDSGYVVELLPAPANYPVEDAVANASMLNALIATGVNLAPAQYYWFHRRFKTQPGLAKAALYNR